MDRDRIGAALYPLSSFMNHSCDSNVIRDTSHKNFMYFFAGQRITPGDEVSKGHGELHEIIRVRKTCIF